MKTDIGTGAVSISSAAVELVQQKVENLSNYKVAIIGAGKMSRLLVTHLLAKGSKDITLVNRSEKRAKELAKGYPQIEIPIHLMPDMMDVIAKSDIVFTSTGATQPILDRGKLEEVLGTDKSLMLVDISVPLNVAKRRRRDV